MTNFYGSFTQSETSSTSNSINLAQPSICYLELHPRTQNPVIIHSTMCVFHSKNKLRRMIYDDLLVNRSTFLFLWISLTVQLRFPSIPFFRRKATEKCHVRPRTWQTYDYDSRRNDTATLLPCIIQRGETEWQFVGADDDDGRPSGWTQSNEEASIHLLPAEWAGHTSSQLACRWGFELFFLGQKWWRRMVSGRFPNGNRYGETLDG